MRAVAVAVAVLERKCRTCGCTDSDCSRCIWRTGRACHWVEDDLCSACAGEVALALDWPGRSFGWPRAP